MIKISDDSVLLCPLCGKDTTHLDEVRVSARPEDDEPNEIAVDTGTGRVRTHEDIPAPMGDRVHEGRRDRIALVGWCEQCGDTFALVFTQHKGATFVEAVRSGVTAGS
ncbi:hypothetical protein [Actinopolymorpha rutila]|uniref:Uncharacterized protein n=1 Tax=Actinopolymorpha rutila TaxID=446787 RepID=A0A852ZIF6_9ACTN|nr:hypothetical protein [Actinopolymorpha rutila]NYH92837.1 hypothetical protein [Actinopolymorpha rutila]